MATKASHSASATSGCETSHSLCRDRRILSVPPAGVVSPGPEGTYLVGGPVLAVFVRNGNCQKSELTYLSPSIPNHPFSPNPHPIAASMKAVSVPRTLLIAAPPDDETIGAAIRISRTPGIRIVHVTEGSPDNPADAIAAGFSTREAYAAARHQETLRALAL